MTLEVTGCWYFGNCSFGNRPWASPYGLEAKIESIWGRPDLFVCDRVGRKRPAGVLTVDIDAQWRPHILADMHALPFASTSFRFAFWDPPYDRAYKNAWQEVKRVSGELAAGLHYYVLDAGVGWKLAAVVPILSGGAWHRVRVLTVVRRLAPDEQQAQAARKVEKRLRHRHRKLQQRLDLGSWVGLGGASQ